MGRAKVANEQRKLYKEGDTVELEFQLYPGPVEFKTNGKVIKCLSPTYYVIEYVDHKGERRTTRLIRSHLR
jgi:hypothetical protein